MKDADMVREIVEALDPIMKEYIDREVPLAVAKAMRMNALSRTYDRRVADNRNMNLGRRVRVPSERREESITDWRDYPPKAEPDKL